MRGNLRKTHHAILVPAWAESEYIGMGQWPGMRLSFLKDVLLYFKEKGNDANTFYKGLFI